jgi:ATP adenylyltransferase
MHAHEATRGWDLLIDSILASSTDSNVDQILPFTHFARSFASTPSGADLLKVYHELYNVAKEAGEKLNTSTVGSLSKDPVDERDSPFSYNLAMTSSGMAILPRRAEGTMLRRDDGSEIGYVALNGTTLGGTMMVSGA